MYHIIRAVTLELFHRDMQSFAALFSVKMRLSETNNVI